jgi:hypothetical protein
MPVSSYPKSARKAYRSMTKQYGKKRGRRIFYATANKRGRGKTNRAKASSAFRKKRR